MGLKLPATAATPAGLPGVYGQTNGGFPAGASTTHYSGPYTGLSDVSEGPKQVPIRAATFTRFCVSIGTAQPASGAYTLTVRKNGVDTALVVVIPAGSPTGTTVISTGSVPFADGDLLSVKQVNAATASAAEIGGWFLDGSDDGSRGGFTACLGGGTVPAASAVQYSPFLNRSGISAGEFSNWMPMPQAYNVTKLTVVTTGAQPGDGALVLTLRKNAADTTLVLTIPAGSPAGKYSATGDIAYEQGDRVNFKMVNSSPGTVSAPLAGAYIE